MKYLFIIFLSTVSIALYGQDYKTMVWEAMDKLNIIKKPAGNNRYHFKYKVQILPRDKKQSSTRSTVETIVAKDRIMIKSDYVDYYQDEKRAFTILKGERKVLLNNSMQKAWQQQDFTGFAQMKKDFFEDAKYSRVTRTNEPEDIILVKMQPSAERCKKGQLQHLLIELNTRTKQVTRMLIMHSTASEYKITEYIYEKMELKSKTSIYNDITAYVMTNDLRLKSPYKGYQLIDLRKHK